MKYTLDFHNKIVLVTGAAQGIGKSISIGFASLGATVLLVDLEQNERRMLEIVNTADDVGGRAELFCCDITNDASVDKMMNDIKRQYGRVDILINNAGIYRTGPSVE